MRLKAAERREKKTAVQTEEQPRYILTLFYIQSVVIGCVDGAGMGLMIDGSVGVIIDFGEDIIFPLEFGDPVGFDTIFRNLRVNAVEARDVVASTFFGIFDGGIGCNDERPVGGLSEEEFSCRLIECAFEVAVGIGEASRQFDHTFFGAMEMGVDPVISIVKPDFEEAVCAPAREARHDFLVYGFDVEVFAWRNHFDFVLIASGFSHEHFEEFRTFVPPMPVEFGVVGRGDMGRDAQDLFEITALSLTIEEEVTGVIGGAIGCPIGDVGFFSVEGDLTGNAEEFESGISSDAVVMEVGTDFCVRQIEPAIAIELAIIRMPGVTDFGAPDLSGAFEVTRESGDAAGRDDGSEGTVARGRIALGESMRFEDEEGDAIFGEQCVDPGDESAFGEPDTAGSASEMFFIIIDGDADLRASSLIGRHERQEAVCSAASNDFEDAIILELFEDGQELTMPNIFEEAFCFCEFVGLSGGGILEGCTLFFDAHFFGEFRQFIDMADVAFLQEWVGEHFAQRRSQAHGQSEIDAIIAESAHHAQERDIGFGHCLEQPIFFEEVGIFRVSDKGKMGMQDDAEIAL